MRVSNIAKYLGGADNVNAFELIQGEQRIYTGAITETIDDETAPVDITNFTLTAIAEFYTASVTASSRAVQINGFEKLDSLPAKSLPVIKTDLLNGEFTVEIPDDIYEEDVPLDAQNLVPVAVIWLGYDDGEVPATIRQSRLLAIIRRGRTSL